MGVKFKQDLLEMIQDLGLKKGDSISLSEMLFWFSKNKHDGKIPEKEFTFGPGLEIYTANSRWRTWDEVTPEDDLFFMEFVLPYEFHIYDKEKDPPAAYTVDDYYKYYGNPSFSYEKDLQNYLSKNLEILEPGLRLYEADGISGIEFPVGNRRIDILAIDNNNNFVVIETKVSKLHEKVIGQLMTYMGYVKHKLADPNQIVRGIIVGAQISNEIKMAASMHDIIDLFEYDLLIEIKKI